MTGSSRFASCKIYALNETRISTLLPSLESRTTPTPLATCSGTSFAQSPARPFVCFGTFRTSYFSAAAFISSVAFAMSPALSQKSTNPFPRKISPRFLNEKLQIFQLISARLDKTTKAQRQKDADDNLKKRLIASIDFQSETHE